MENPDQKFLSRSNRCYRVVYLTDQGTAGMADYYVPNIVELLKHLGEIDLQAVIIKGVDCGEETTEEDYKLVAEVQRIHKESAQDKANQKAQH